MPVTTAVSMSAATTVTATMTMITATVPSASVWVTAVPSAVAAAPVIGISYITAVSDNHLIMTAAIAGIMVPVVCVTHPWVTIIYYNLVAIVNIIVTIPYR